MCVIQVKTLCTIHFAVKIYETLILLWTVSCNYSALEVSAENSNCHYKHRWSMKMEINSRTVFFLDPAELR